MSTPSFRPYTELILSTCTWWKDAGDFITRDGSDYNEYVKPNKPTRLWRDDSANVQPNASHGSIFDIFGGGAVDVSRQYSILDLDAAGRPVLVPIDSPQFYDTNTSLTVMNTYREYRAFFVNGVPSCKRVTLPLSEAKDPVIVGSGSLPPIGYPLDIRTNIILLPMNGTVVWLDYQEFSAYAKSLVNPAGSTDEQRIASAIQIGQNAATPAPGRRLLMIKALEG